MDRPAGGSISQPLRVWYVWSVWGLYRSQWCVAWLHLDSGPVVLWAQTLSRTQRKVSDITEVYCAAVLDASLCNSAALRNTDSAELTLKLGTSCRAVSSSRWWNRTQRSDVPAIKDVPTIKDAPTTFWVFMWSKNHPTGFYTQRALH